MSKCDHERRFRECFLVNREMGIKRWLPHAISVLGREVTIPEWGETFFVKSMSADYLCERALRAKAEKRPTLYRILEPDEPVLPPG